MCGPLALALPTGGRGGIGFAAGRVLYNLGRITTYTLIGLFFGLIGRSLLWFGVQQWVSIGAGAVILIGLVLSNRLGLATPAFATVGWLKSRLGRLLTRRSLGAMYLFGVLNGLLPCGLVYAAGTGAAAAGGIAAGMAYMAVFGIGTTPLMLGLALSPRVLPNSFRAGLRRVVPASLVLVAGLLIVRGLALGIPYLSPALDVSGHAAPCH